jgi:hypothetical protein
MAVRTTLDLLRLAALLLLAGGWLVGGMVGVGAALVVLAAGVAALALLRELPEPPDPRLHDIEALERARRAP